jgi:transcriptional regulator with XRE-family HTH domain
MTGMEFRSIRMYNQITQLDFAYNVGLRNRHSIQKLERRNSVPPKYVRVLSQMIGLNLMDENIFKNHYEEIPESYKRINYTEATHVFAGGSIRFPKEEINRMSEKELANYKKWDIKIIPY